MANRADIYTDLAAFWHTRLESGNMTDADQAEFQAWLDEDPSNEQELESLKELTRKMGSAEMLVGSMAKGGEYDEGLAASIYEASNLVVMHRKKKKLQTRIRQAMAVAAVFMCAFLIQLQWSTFSPNGASVYATAIGEQKKVMLADGSMVTLNTNTELSVALTADVRRLQLIKGEAYFEVAKDRSRPFEVAVGDTFVKAVGTAFSIRQDTKEISVVVTEGEVEVRRTVTRDLQQETSKPDRKSLIAGHQLTIREEGIVQSVLSTPEVSQLVTWRTGRLVMDEATITEIVEKIQPYVAEKIIVADAKVGSMVASGVFEIGDIESFFGALKVALPVDVVDEGGVILLMSRETEKS